MKHWSSNVRSMFVTCMCLFLLMFMLCGCKTNSQSSPAQLAAQTELQARVASLTDDVRKLAIMQGGAPVIPDILSITPEKGAAGASYKGRLARNPATGEAVIIDGEPIFEGSWAIGTSTSMREVGGMDKAYLKLGGWAVNPNTGEMPKGSGLDGLFLYMEGSTMTSGLDSDFAKVWGDASVAQKEAAGNALKAYYEGRKGLYETVITSAGQQVRGILKEIYTVTPVGGALAAVRALVEANGQNVEGVITTPYVTTPDGTPIKSN